jgi:hypothetical protein
LLNIEYTKICPNSINSFKKEIELSDKELIDKIEKVRVKNNKLWMQLLRIAMTEKPVQAKKILAGITKNDMKISKFTRRLSEIDYLEEREDEERRKDSMNKTVKNSKGYIVEKSSTEVRKCKPVVTDLENLKEDDAPLELPVVKRLKIKIIDEIIPISWEQYEKMKYEETYTAPEDRQNKLRDKGYIK